MLTWASSSRRRRKPRPADASSSSASNFEILADRTAYVTYRADGQTSVRWRNDEDGEKHLHRPGI